MLRRSIATNLMLITLQTLSVFGLIWTMTKGPQQQEHHRCRCYAYHQAFQFPARLRHRTGPAAVAGRRSVLANLPAHLRLGES